MNLDEHVEGIYVAMKRCRKYQTTKKWYGLAQKRGWWKGVRIRQNTGVRSRSYFFFV